MFSTLFIFIGGPTEYIPGNSGGPWTNDEINIVREKIFQLINPIKDEKDKMFGGRKIYFSEDGPISGID